MISYSEIVQDHFQHPRNVGDLDRPDAVGVAENPICGDRVRMALRISDGRIEIVRWRGEGCVPSIAAASLASELVEGQPVADVGSFDETALGAALGGVPPRKAHALSLIVTALRSALHNYAAASGDSPVPPNHW